MATESHHITKLIIKQEYLELVPRLSEDDRNRLKESLKKDGQLIPIAVTPQGIILDGHTRYELCNELGIHPIRYKVMKFDNMDDEMRFVVMTNLARRQLNKFQKVELAWPLYELEKKRALELVKGAIPAQDYKVQEYRLISSACNKLHLNMAVQQLALRIVEAIHQLGKGGGKSPNTISAYALYEACLLSKYNLDFTKDEFAEIFKITGVSMRNCARDVGTAVELVQMAEQLKSQVKKAKESENA